MSGVPQRLNLKFRITWRGSWHVGNGQSSLLVDRQISRRRRATAVAAVENADAVDERDDRSDTNAVSAMVPYVPGAQFKGVLRHRCEQLAATLVDEGKAVIDPHAVSRPQILRLREHFQPLRQAQPVIDRLFGTRYQGGCLFVSDALSESNTTAPASQIHTRTAIDRLTGTVRRHHLFSTEITRGTPEETFSGSLRARHPADVMPSVWDADSPPLEYALLIAGLLSIDTLGGDRSAGRGHCSVSIDEGSLRWKGQPLTLSEALACFEDDWAGQLALDDEERAGSA